MKSSDPPWLLRHRSSTAFIIATVWISSFTDYFLYAMVVPILPTALVERANIPYDDREYWVSVLLMSEALTAFLCCPIFGYLVDAAPTRRAPYLLGLIFLGASMGMLAFARSTAVFVIARLLQGSATAMVAVAGLALLTDSVPFDNLGQTIGYQGSAIALGFMLGPLLGGIIYQQAGYGVTMAVAGALVGVDLIMRVVVIEKGVAAKWINDFPEDSGEPILSVQNEDGYHTFGAPPASNGLSEDESSDVQANGYGDEDDEQESATPTILQIASQPRVVISSFGLLVQGLLFSAFDATIPIFVETTFNWTALGAGIAFLPSALTALLEPFFGYISDKHGPRIPTFTSFILLPLPLMGMAAIKQNTPAHMAGLLCLLTLTGLLMNLAIPALFVEAQDVLVKLQSQSQSQQPTPTHQNQHHPQPQAKTKTKTQKNETRGIAQSFGLQTMAQFLGMFLGSLWGGFVEWRFGWTVMVFSLGNLCFLSAFAMLGLGERGDYGHEGNGWVGRVLERLWLRRGKKVKGRNVDGEGEREGLLAH
ncbi:MFS transporter [Aspergillus stella-maris]|uniref:MFS transporter n=1 Tax=Aspergillus stella-maris TaxID=1810926 RepID=UPI003CCD34BE